MSNFAQDQSHRPAKAPDSAGAFAARLNWLLLETATPRHQLEIDLGWRDTQIIDSIISGGDSADPFDFIVDLADWAIARGVRLEWLFAGAGEMRSATSSSVSVTPTPPASDAPATIAAAAAEPNSGKASLLWRTH